MDNSGILPDGSDIELVQREYGDFGSISFLPTGEGTGHIVLKYPIKFIGSSFSGLIDLGYRLSISKIPSQNGYD